MCTIVTANPVTANPVTSTSSFTTASLATSTPTGAAAQVQRDAWHELCRVRRAVLLGPDLCQCGQLNVGRSWVQRGQLYIM